VTQAGCGWLLYLLWFLVMTMRLISADDHVDLSRDWIKAFLGPESGTSRVVRRSVPVPYQGASSATCDSPDHVAR
jgi:hypothetical protein